MLHHNFCPVCSNKELKPYLQLKDYFLTLEKFELLRCNQCGLLVTNPYPDKENAFAYYESKNYLSHQSKKFGFLAFLYSFSKKYTMRYKYKIATKGISKGKVLDIGCGIGDFLKQCKNKNWEINGIEPVNDAAAIAENKLRQKIFKPEYLPELNNRAYDLITFWHVLEHLHDLHQQLVQIKRVLKPTGRLVIALPNYESNDAIHYQEYWAAYDVPRHIFHFNQKALNLLLTNHGFVPEKQYPLYLDAYYVAVLSEKYKGRRGITLYLAAFLQATISNLKALNSGKYSSIVYVFRLENQHLSQL